MEEQDKNERRKIRYRYRELINQAQLELSADNTDPKTWKVLQEAKSLFDQVKMTREAALDSQLIGLIAQISKKKAQGLKTDFHTFDPTTFVDKLITYLSGIPNNTSGSMDVMDNKGILLEGWERLGKLVSFFFKKAPVYNYMFGSFEREKVNLKVYKRKEGLDNRDTFTKVVVPKVVPKGERVESDSTSEEVERVLGILQELHKRQGNVCFFEFVINPNSFAHTIENMFHVAFLIQDGLAEISIDLDKLPVITPVYHSVDLNKPVLKNFQQVIMTITEKEWRGIIETFKICFPMIPPRTSTSDNK